MKKLFTLLFSTMFISVFSQSFPENNPEILLNKIVKPVEITQSLQQYGYKNFFVEFDKDQKQFTKSDFKNMACPTGSSYSTSSDYNKLVGKEFKVLGVFEIVPKNSISGKEYAIEIENSEIGKIYYKYNPEYESSFELEVVGSLDFPKDFFCSKIEHKKDKFENKETFYSPYENGISFTKTIVKGKTNIYLSVRVNGSTLNVGKKGLNILFQDGTKFTKPLASIDTDTGDGSGYVYSAFISLTQAEIKLFTDKSITDTRVYIYDDTIDKDSARKIREYLKCLSR